MSERKVFCDVCNGEAVCVSNAFAITALYRESRIGSTTRCEQHCDHKAPAKCLPIVRYERGAELDA